MPANSEHIFRVDITFLCHFLKMVLKQNLLATKKKVRIWLYATYDAFYSLWKFGIWKSGKIGKREKTHTSWLPVLFPQFYLKEQLMFLILLLGVETHWTSINYGKRILTINCHYEPDQPVQLWTPGQLH